MRHIFFLLLVSPCLAQMDRAAFFSGLKQSDQVAFMARLQEECIGFRMTQTDLDQLASQPEVVLALLQCLHDQAQHGPEVTGHASLSASVSDSKANPVAITQSRNTPNVATNLAEFNLIKLTEAINTLSLAAQLENRSESLAMRMGALPLIANLIREHGHLVDGNLLQKRLPAGFHAPDWVLHDLTQAKEAGEKGYPTLKFNAHKSMIFDAGRSKKGAQVFLGVYRVDNFPQPGSIYHFEDHFIYSHQSFPVVYDRNKDQFQHYQIPNDAFDLSLGKKLNDNEPITLFPGKWVLELQAKDGENRLRFKDKIWFQVENGNSYTLDMKLEKDRKGVLHLKGELR